MPKFILASVVAIVYMLFLFLEMRFIIKENKPLKFLLRDTLVVYISFIVGMFIYQQLAPLSSLKNIPEVFTNKANF